MAFYQDSNHLILGIPNRTSGWGQIIPVVVSTLVTGVILGCFLAVTVLSF